MEEYKHVFILGQHYYLWLYQRLFLGKNIQYCNYNSSHILKKEIVQEQFKKFEVDYLHKSIEFISENSTENLSLLISDVAVIKLADNYVEIVFMEDKLLKKKLIRGTLKNIELQLKPYPNFIRCHRICTINKYYIEKLNRKFNNYWLTIRGLQDPIPVSRQYLLKLKEAI